MANPILPRDLTAAPSVPGSAVLIIDNGVTVQKATPAQIGDTARPFANQAEAEAGGDNTKTMTPLRVRQAIDSQAIGKAMAAAVGIAGDATNLGTIGTSLVGDNLTVKQAFESAGDNLFAPTGSGLMGLSVTEAYARGTTGWKAVQQVHLDDAVFGGPADEVSDSSTALVAACARLTTITGGGIVRITGRRRIASTVTIPNGVVLVGESAQHGDIYPSSDGNRGATLIVDSAATILLRNGSGARNLMVKRNGLTYGISSAQVASTFAGTAFTLATNTGDHILENLDILGFQYAVKSQDTTTVGPTVQTNRTRIFNVRGDCLNGIWLHNAYDIPYIDKVHFWPYVTVGSAAEAGDAQLKRPGVAFKLTGKNDWTKVTNSFSFGYAIGVQVTDGHSVTFLDVSHDHPPGSTDGSKGYYFDGDASEIRVIGGQVAGKQYGAHVDCTTSSGRLGATFSACNIWVTTTQAIRVQVGSVQVIGGSLRNDPTSPNGIGIKNENTGTAEVTVLGVDFAGLANAIDNQATTSILRHSSCTFRNVTTQITNAYVATAAPAVTATAGAITTSAAACQYRRDAGYVSFSMNITVTTNGTGAGTLRATVPFAAASGVDYVFVGRDRGVGGKAITATLIGGGNTLDIKNYDNTYPAADGSVIIITGTYRIA